MSPGCVRTQGLRLGLWPTGLGLGFWSNGLGLGLGLWSNGLGLTPDGLGLWPDGLGLGLGLWPCGLGLTAGLTSPDSLQYWLTAQLVRTLCCDPFGRGFPWFRESAIYNTVLNDRHILFESLISVIMIMNRSCKMVDNINLSVSCLRAYISMANVSYFGVK